MSKSLFLPALPLLRRRHLNLREIENLLELLPYAALLLETQTNQILLTNAKATEITAYTRAEMIKLDIDSLLPGLVDQYNVQASDGSGNIFPTDILKRSGSKEEVFVTLYHLDEIGSCVLASIETVSSHEQPKAERQRLAHRLQGMLSLVLAIQEPNVQHALEQVLQVGQNITGASVLVIYLADPKNPGVQRRTSIGKADYLPQRIPPAEIGEMLEPNLWTLGKRVTNSLQKSARTENLSYVATTPLDQPKAFSGLVVLADPKKVPSNDVLPLLKILAATITTIIQQHTLVTNLHKSQKNKLRAITIGDDIKAAIQEGVIVLAPDLKINEMNPSSEWMLGYASREVDRQPIENVLIGAENLVPALQAAQQGIAIPNLGNVRLHRRDGTTFLAHLRILPITIEDKLEGVNILVRDLSEREEFQERSQQLEQRAILGEVTSIFAHEVRNPINNISTGLQLMALDLAEDDPNQKQIRDFQEDLNRVTYLMQTVLEFARPAEIIMETVDLNVLINRLLKRWHPRLARVNVETHITSLSEIPIVNADPRALEQVFSNLIGNAVDAMGDEGGNLVINIRSDSEQDDPEKIVVAISDTGPGIPENIKERIFDPFFTTKERKGTGLGLAIAKRIVNRHEGTIDVNSVPGGTVFQVVLPAIEK